MRLIVGLGNPGAKYARTRHNAGFDVVDILSQRHRIPLKRSRFHALVGEGRISGNRVILAQPNTYMNESGRSVLVLCNYFKPQLSDLLLIYDDVDLPEGKLRIRKSGSAGTHNGMRSVIYHLQREDFARVRVGIGGTPDNWDIKDYVLSHYDTPELRQLMFDAFLRAADAVERYVASDIEEAMREYNS